MKIVISVNLILMSIREELENYSDWVLENYIRIILFIPWMLCCVGVTIHHPAGITEKSILQNGREISGFNRNSADIVEKHFKFLRTPSHHPWEVILIELHFEFHFFCLNALAFLVSHDDTAERS